MTKNQSLFFRVLFFLAGAGIIILAFCLTTGNRELTGTDGFLWTSISLMYLIFFLPFFFSAINIGNFSGKIPVISLVWFGIILYIAASITVLVLLLAAFVLSLTAAVIIQAVLLFLFFVDVYFAYFAGDHIGAVAAEEAGKRQLLAQIKSKAQVLQLSIEKFQPESVQKILTRALDDIKYIYPVNGGGGTEAKILNSLEALSELAGGSGVNPSAQEAQALALQALVNERKLLRN